MNIRIAISANDNNGIESTVSEQDNPYYANQARGHITAHSRGGKIIAQGGFQGVKHLLCCRAVDDVDVQVRRRP